MNRGFIEQIGPPTEIYNNPENRFVASFIGEMNFLEEDGKVTVVRPEDVLIRPCLKEESEYRVVQVMPLGHYVQVLVQKPFDQTLKVFVNKADSGNYKVDQPVLCSFINKKILQPSR